MDAADRGLGMARTGMRTIATMAGIAALALPAAAPAPPMIDPVPLEQNDAGTGRDAGTDFETAIPIERGVQYTATLIGTSTDGRVGAGDTDWFTFEALAGESIAVMVTDEAPAPYAPNCVTVRDAEGTELASSVCGNELTFTVPEDGTYAAAFGYFAVVPTDYAFVVDPSPDQFGTSYGTAGHDLAPDPDAPTVVVAVGDTGVNPYHEAYHRPLLTEHPCTWVEGFDDCSVPPLELSIGEYATYEEAYAADEAVWQSLEVGQWYWIPRTNIIGAVCDGSTNAAGQPPPVSPEAPCIHDEDGHGTGTTSSVLSEAPDALLLVHEGNSGASALADAPVVPDIQSHSWGPPAPLPLHAADPVTQTAIDFGLADTGGFDPETLFFIAAGNSAPFPTFIDSSRVHPAVQVVGGGFPGKATTSSWSTFDFTSWFCRPTATHDSIRTVRASYCGTSFSAPTVAGTAAAALLELRRAEGYTGRSTTSHVTPLVSRDDFVAALRAAATYDAGQRFGNSSGSLGVDIDLPPGHEHYFWGYGWLDADRIDEVVTCASGGDCPTASEDAQRWNEARQEIRRRQTQGLP